MTDIKLDVTTHDIDISTGDLQLLTGIEAIAQHIRIRLQFFLGEWMLDTRLGIPYFQHVLIKNPKTAVVRGILRKAIQETPGVVSVSDLLVDYAPTTRQMTVSFSAATDTGEPLTFTEEFII